MIRRPIRANSRRRHGLSASHQPAPELAELVKRVAEGDADDDLRRQVNKIISRQLQSLFQICLLEEPHILPGNRLVRSEGP